MEHATVIIPLVIGYILDLILGDPRWLPHPIRLFGNSIAFGEKKLNTNPFAFIKGMALTIGLLIGTIAFFYYTQKLISSYTIAYYTFTSIFVFYALANKSLIDEGKAVFTALQEGIAQGRKRLSWIVGRETDQLNPQQIKTAVFETLSENLSDGVIAPLFYYTLFGVAGAMGYKMINTLDSMIGYKNERYIHFGKFAAKLDDVVNYIPARLTAFLMLLVTGKLHKISFVVQYGKQHSSPNAGYPEAALAAILDCKFGGPNYYHGKLVDKPFIGTNDRILKDQEIKTVARINQKVTFTFVLLICMAYYFLYYIARQ
ncbi:adenosylcobinamide-phosphate synthase [Aquimarina sp. EL_43]|uniref:adenosylcobinamide-phosphate synthase CbiB n=1 Tax=unclassified Aquimarina TaxID=2627091 RepID=UPI0018CB217F|nr:MULTISPECIES: adenosylcobinamide-phosphate synthase CbiB [unclassified Aquimarina]MBG6130243.1 adenosylcobinamide-phosphate synthase [Aquimarina sp. EL_35]MBG6149023.1 adenosylcobinamide-phosphate synthase [Aquimarina sp. EL_32]MBG6168603.1 adenosylcobinamide-phosphate synthase [Aquimarina sp. EL_43]